MNVDTDWLRMLTAQIQQELGAGKRMWTLKEILDALDRAIAWSLISYIKP